jgi:Tol biopolymer transport system component
LVRAGVQRFCGAAWSPDGQRLACAGISHRHPRATGIWTIRAADGGDPRQLTSYPVGEDSPGDFSPDGTRLVFLRSDASDRPTGIFTVKIDGSDVQRLTPRGMIIDGFAGSWSPSGDKILFVAKTDRAHRWSIWSVDANGTGVQPIPIVGCGGAFADPGSAACTYPGWSPDGTKILFTLGIGKRSDIAIVNADGSGFVQITNSGDADEADWGTRATIP